MLTVAVLLSGPHRQSMLETALASIPLESAALSQVLIRHQGGPWDWGGELRERLEAHPKVRIVEFPDKVDFAQSFNRTLDAIDTPWALMLPDDDYLIRPAAQAGFETVAADPAASSCGFVAFGWYFLRDNRYLASYVKRHDLFSMLHYAPKFCTTMLNLRRVRELGGFDPNVGGLLDSALFARLAYEYDALLAKTPIGIYRLHSGQESFQRLPVPQVEALRDLLVGYARNPGERKAFERRLPGATWTRPNRATELLHELSFRLRSQARPAETDWQFGMSKWSSR
ncbi:MAG: hypothetical protein ACR2FI_03450 [Burkholderiales bacterium]|nr:hypothetical protein [Pseudomonadota bacterium]